MMSEILNINKGLGVFACRFKRRLIALSVILLCASPISAIGAPNVAVSIAPIHSLVSMVMQGVGQPHLLIKQIQSPHSASIKPSARQHIAQAELIVWVGAQFETGLQKPISLTTDSTRVITLIKQATMQTLPNRQQGQWQSAHQHGTNIKTMSDHAPVLMLDPHLWLSHKNAIEIIKIIQANMIELDPKNKSLYLKNSEQAIARIQQQRLRLSKMLVQVKSVPYLVFHDAYQYFEQQFDLGSVGSVTLNPEQNIGIKTLLALKQTIKARHVQCVFHEPQFKPKLVQALTKQAQIGVAELDPLGVGIMPGVNQWFELMDGLSKNLQRCLRA